MTKDQKLERVTVLLPHELIDRIDAYRFGEPYDDLIATIANSDRKSGRITLLLPRETIEMLDA